MAQREASYRRRLSVDPSVLRHAGIQPTVLRLQQPDHSGSEQCRKYWSLSLASALLGVPLGQTYIGQTWTESFDELGFYIQDQWKATPKLSVNVGLRYDKLNPMNNINGALFGGFDVNTGFYDISGTQLPPQCATANAAPCLPGPLSSLPFGNHIGLAPCASFRCPQDFNFGPHVGLAYTYDNKTVIRGGYGLVYDEFAGFLQDTANHVGNWPDAQTVFQSLNGTLGAPLVNMSDLQNLSAAPLPTADPWGRRFWKPIGSVYCQDRRIS